MKISTKLKSIALCVLLISGNIFYAQTPEVDLSQLSEQEIGELQKIMEQEHMAQKAKKIDYCVSIMLRLQGQIEELLQDLSLSLTNEAFKLKNKDQLIEQIKQLRTIVGQIKNEKFVQVDPQTLQFLVSFNHVLMEHISQALSKGLKEIPPFQEKIALVLKKSASIDLEQIEQEIINSEMQLFELQKQASEFGISWYNKLSRKAFNMFAIAQRKNIIGNAELTTIAGLICLHYIHKRTKLLFSEKERAEWQLIHLSQVDIKDKDEIFQAEHKEHIEACLQAFENGSSELSWMQSFLRKLLGLPLAMDIKTNDPIEYGRGYKWNNEKVNLFGKIPTWAAATFASLIGSYGPILNWRYGANWWLKLKSWGANKINILQAKMIGGTAGRQAEEAVNKKEKGNKWDPKYTFDDVVGFDHIKETLKRVLEYIKDPERFDRANIQPECGYLFTGIPGTGKSFVAEAFAGEIRKAFKEIGRKEDELGFYCIDALTIKTYKVEDMLRIAREESPCVLFIDEIDLLRLQRGGKGDNNLLSEVLNAMSGVMSKDDGKQIILIAATNKPEHLDRALRRRGRFGKIINFELPTLAERKEFFTKKLEPLLPNLQIIDIDALAQQTEDCTYEELEAMTNSALTKSKLSGIPVTQEHLEDSLNEEIRNVINKDMHVSQEEQELMAVHQAGHALALELLQTRRQLAGVTIKPITAELQDEGLKHFEERKQKDVVYGRVFSKCSFDHLGMYQKDETIKECKILLAGIAAEKIIFGSCSYSYHTDDKQQALEMVKKMVFEGLNVKKMPSALQVKYFEKALDIAQQYQDEVEQLLREHEDVLRQIASELQERKTLPARRIKKILEEKQNGTLVEGSVACPA